jgi:hypothetical protein
MEVPEKCSFYEAIVAIPHILEKIRLPTLVITESEQNKTLIQFVYTGRL